MIGDLKSDYGGSLRNKREGRSRGRPISTKHTMHLILRSTLAKGGQSFRVPKHDKNARRIIGKFAAIYGVRVISIANAWNHWHLQIQLTNRFTYNAFIRAITGAIAMSVTGRNRWSPAKAKPVLTPRPTAGASLKFWDHRPFTRIVESLRARLTLADYIRMNQIEGDGFQRSEARSMVQVEKVFERGRRRFAL